MIVCTLKQYVDRNDLNITALSKRCGVSRPPLIALANGTSKGIQFDTLDKLCRFFGISPSDLLLRVDESSVHLWADFSSVSFDEPSRTVCSGSISVGQIDIDVEILLTVGADDVDAEIRLSRDAIEDEQVSFLIDVMNSSPDLDRLIHHTVEEQATDQMVECLPNDEMSVFAELVL